MSLFWKIFLWFWGAMVLIGVALYLVVLTTRPDPLPGAWRDTAGATMATTATAAISEWERGGQSALAKFLGSAGQRSSTRFWLFDENGRELSELPLPLDPREPIDFEDNAPRRGRPNDVQTNDHDPRDEAPHDEAPHHPPRDLHLPFGPEPPVTGERLAELRHDAEHQQSAVFGLASHRVMAAQRFRAASGRDYILVGVMPRPMFGRPVADPRTQWLGLVLVLGISGLVCLGLVRYLTAPLVSLRAATVRLAAGDLAARTHAGEHRRRDEVADVGRDFDAMAERIESLVRLQQQLLGDISHELRSPLTRLGMALALARRYNEKQPSEQMNVVLDRIGAEAAQLNALIAQLLELARLEAEEKTGFARLDLADMVREVVADADFEAQGQSRAVRLVRSTACPMLGSRALLGSALENVVRNAIRYTAEGSAIEVALDQEVRAGQPWAKISVRDFGAGVPEEELSQLFRPFYRVAEARDRESGGVGLGLAITERAVLAHGGQVKACNAHGSGLLVELAVPLRDSTTQAD